MTQITNISPGPRGVNVVGGGVVHLAPGQTRDLELQDGELKSLSTDWFRVGKAAKADVAAATEEEAAAKAEAERRAKAEAAAKAEAEAKK